MHALNQNLTRKLDELADQFDQISARLIDPDTLSDHRAVRALSIKRASIEPTITLYRAYRSLQSQIDELQSLITRQGDGDADLLALAREELPALQHAAADLINRIQKLLVTADDQSVGSIIIEIRAGVGGDEAGIWAGDLHDMYQRFAASRRWRFEDLDASPAVMGGYKNIISRIEGEAVWANLGYEGGTHQVKRIPATEAQGRVHTSTATVAVLPEPEEVEVSIAPFDVKEMITTAQGPGGQNVNKVATAVHLIHLPTGIEVRMQDTKSQSQNRERAWSLLRARLYERQKAEADAQRAEARSSMIGTASRAEKIRTYRYKDNLVVDHRIERSFNLSRVLAGELEPLIEALIEHETSQRLAAL